MNHDKEVFGPLPKKQDPVFYHPFGLELYDATAMDLHAMTYAEQCVAAVRAKSAEADLLESLRLMVDLVELAVPFEGDTLRRARAAIARATGEQP
jgi:hypothetical protein